MCILVQDTATDESIQDKETVAGYRRQFTDHRLLLAQVASLEGQLKAVHKAFEGTKLNLNQAIEACNFATKKRRAAERQLAKLQVCHLMPLYQAITLYICA